MNLTLMAEELRLGTDRQSIIRTFQAGREPLGERPRESVLMLMELPDKPQEAAQLIDTIGSTLNDLCFTGEGGSAERFEIALKEVNAVINEMQDSMQQKRLGRINAVVALVSGTDVHITQAGEAEGYLLRRASITTATEGLTADHGTDTFVNIASGTLEKGDTLVLATERLLRYATKLELTKIFSPSSELTLALEKLDELLVLEGAQSTGVLALSTQLPGQMAETDGFDLFGKKLPPLSSFGPMGKKVSSGLAWMQDSVLSRIGMPAGPHNSIDRNYLIFGFLVIVIISIISVSVSLSSDRNEVASSEARAALASAEEQIKIAKLNQAIGEKDTAHARLTEAENIIAVLLENRVALDDAEMTQATIQSLRDELDSIRRVSTATALEKVRTSVEGLVQLRGQLLAVNAQEVVDVINNSNRETVLEEGRIAAADTFLDRDALVFLTANGVAEWRNNTTSFMDTTDDTWRTGVDIASYANFIYVLDPINNQIWKYSRRANDYGSGQPYSNNTDVTNAVALAIDGDIWVLNNDEDDDPTNDIVRIRRGERQDLFIEDLPPSPWGSPTQIFTNENLRFVYVLDAERNRIVRLFKDPPEAGFDARKLVHNAQFVFEDMPPIIDFYVDNTEQKMFLITEEALYEIGI